MKKILCFGILGTALVACSNTGKINQSFDMVDSTVIDSLEIVDSLTIDTAAVDTICVD